MAVTTKFYSATGVQIPFDGFVRRLEPPGGEDWDALHDHTDGNAVDPNNTVLVVRVSSSSTTNKWSFIGRTAMLFDISSLPSNAVFSEVKLVIVTADWTNTGDPTWSPGIAVYASNPTSDSGLAFGDYSTFGTTAFSTPLLWDSGQNYSELTIEFTLNSIGIAVTQTALGEDGIVRLGLRESTYDAPDIEPSWISNKSSNCRPWSADAETEARKPYLQVTYTSLSYPTDAITRVTQITKMHERRKDGTHFYNMSLQLGGLPNLTSLEDAFDKGLFQLSPEQMAWRKGDLPIPPIFATTLLATQQNRPPPVDPRHKPGEIFGKVPLSPNKGEDIIFKPLGSEEFPKYKRPQR